MEDESDVVVVGGGHNGLICAAYLAEAGFIVTVLEARDIIGGNTTTEELTLAGWQHDSCSSAHVVIQSNPLIAHDELGLLSRYGLSYIATDPAVVFPVEGAEALAMYRDLEATCESIAGYSREDAQALRAMMKDWSEGLRVAHAHYQSGQPLPDSPWSARYDELRAKSAWEVIMTTFTHPVIRRAMMWLSFATIQPPERPGTGALPAAIISGRINFGWSTPVGGSIALPQALERHLNDHQSRVVLSSWVERYLVEDGRCVGVTTRDGHEYRARRAVVAGSHLATLADALESPTPDLLEAQRRWRPGLSVFAVHFALKEHPRYCYGGAVHPSVAAGLGSPQGLQRQVKAALEGRLDASDPWLLLVDSTAVDPTRAPGTTFKFLTIAPETLEGQPWSEEDSRRFAQHLIEFARPFLEGLEDDNILALHCESPTSLAAHNGANIGGSCHGGEFLLDDSSVMPGWMNARSGVDGLYLTGSTSHPGGSVSGRPGRNTARAVLDDLLGRADQVMSWP